MSMSDGAPRFVSPIVGEGTVVLTHRTLLLGISCLLFAPSLLFAGALQLAPALLVAAGCFGALAIVATNAPPLGFLAQPVALRRWVGCCSVALVLLLLGGETHLFHATLDWLVRDAVLVDLVRHGPLSGYRFGESDYLLRAPLGMYMLPALVGRMFGLGAAHGALLAQNTLFLGTILTLLAALGHGRLHVVILVLFGGVSIIGAAMRIAWTPDSEPIPFWLQSGLDSWNPRFQFSSTLVQFFWVPNHALPGWWLATLMLLQSRGQVDLATLGVSVAGALFWSPLCIVPVALWLGVCALRHPRAVTTPRTIIGALAGACFVPLTVYIMLASGSIQSGTPLLRADFLFWYGLFVLIQLPVLGLLFIARDRIRPDERWLLGIAVVTLFSLLPIGFGPNNDLVMRGSIVPLTIVAFIFGRILIEETRQRSGFAIAGWILVVASSPSAAVEVGRALATPRDAISDCSLAEASLELQWASVPTNYVVPISTIPRWLIDVASVSPAHAGKKGCWPDRVRARYFGLERTLSGSPFVPYEP